MVAMMVATMITPKSGVYDEPRDDSTRVMVLSSTDCNTISGHRKLFQVAMKTMMKAAA